MAGNQRERILGRLPLSGQHVLWLGQTWLTRAAALVCESETPAFKLFSTGAVAIPAAVVMPRRHLGGFAKLVSDYSVHNPLN